MNQTSSLSPTLSTSDPSKTTSTPIEDSENSFALPTLRPLPQPSLPTPASSTLKPSLFSDLYPADLFLPDEEEEYVSDYSQNGHNIISSIFTHDALPPNPFSTISPHPCHSLNSSALASALLPSGVTCANGDEIKKKIYSMDDLWTENEVFARKLAPALTFIACLMVVGFLGNALVVYVYGFRFKPATQHFLIVCLSCFDLVMCSVAMPTEMADIRFHHTFDSVFACKLLRFVTMFSSISSSLTLVTVAYDRHRRITKPLSRQMSLRQARIWTLANMVGALCVSWPTLVLTGIRTSQTRLVGLQGTDCSFSERFKKTKYPLVYNAVLGLGFFTLVTVIAVFYFRIWKTARTRKINMAKRYTIGSLSDQCLKELKMKKEINRHEMNDVLSKQLEKCFKQNLTDKASIDCRDIYYFLENNALRTAVSCGIAKKRGRYKEFSLSSPENSSSEFSDEPVLGQSFTYRKSVYSNDKKQAKHKKSQKMSKKSSKGRNFTMGKIKTIAEVQSEDENTNSHSKKAVKVFHDENKCRQEEQEVLDKEGQFSSKFAQINSFTSSKNNINKDQSCVLICDRTNYMKKKYDQLVLKSKLDDPINTSVTGNVHKDQKVVGSPALSIRSNSLIPTSSSSSPSRQRRNSSPLIRPKIAATARLEHRISVVYEDAYQMRPMSSLVDSVSKSLACLREFSDFLNLNPAMEDDLCETANCDEDSEKISDDKMVVEIDCKLIKNDKKIYDEDSERGDYNDKEDTVCVTAKDLDGGRPQKSCFDEDKDLHNYGFIKELPFNDDESSESSTCAEKEVYFHCNEEDVLFESHAHLISSRLRPIKTQGGSINPKCKDINNSSCAIIQTEHTDNRFSFNNNGNTCYKSPEIAFVSEHEKEFPERNSTLSHQIKSSVSRNDSIISKNSTRLITAESSKSAILEDKSQNENGESSSLCEKLKEPNQNGILQLNNTFTSPLFQKREQNSTVEHAQFEVLPKFETLTDSLCNQNEQQNKTAGDNGAVVDVKSESNRWRYSAASLDVVRRHRVKNVCLCFSRNLDKTTIVAFSVSFAFILSFLPFLILMCIRGFVKDFDYNLDGATLCIYHIFLRFYFLNSAINPFLYGLLNGNFRYECLRAWRKFCRCYHGDKTSKKSDTTMI